MASDVGTLDPDAPGYAGKYSDASSTFTASLRGGWTMVGLGAASTVASVVLFIMSHRRTGSGESAKRPVAMPGGAGLVFTFP